MLYRSATPPPSVHKLDPLIKKVGAKSWVHNHFLVYTSDENTANCTICKKDIKWGDNKWGLSTSSLTSHLRIKHRDVYDAAIAVQAKAVSDAADAAAKVPMQKNLTAFFSGDIKDKKETALLKFIIECGLPKGPALTVRTVPAVHFLTHELFVRYGDAGSLQGFDASARSEIQGDG